MERLADRRDWHPRKGGPGKTAWAEYVLPAGGSQAAAPCPLFTAAPKPCRTATARRQIDAAVTLDP